MNLFSSFVRSLKALAPLVLIASSGWAQPSLHRPAAVPLIANDPYFSVWSMADKLTDVPTQHWSGSPQPMTGLVRIDGHVFRWMGPTPRRPRGKPAVDAMPQTSVEVTPLQSKYRFSAAGVELRVTFFTPLFPQDLDILSRPVTYLTWEAVSTDGAAHQVDVLLDVDPLIAVDEPAQPVVWGRSQVGSLTSLNVGTRDQATMHQSGDRVRIDWGYFHLAVPDTAGAETEISTQAIEEFIEQGSLARMDNMEMPNEVASPRGRAPDLAVKLALGSVTGTPVSRHVLLAYTDGAAIEYLGRRLRDYWQRNGMTTAAMLNQSEQDYPSLVARAEKFDAELVASMRAVGGGDYAYLTSLVFRQTIAAHKLAADIDGTPMFFSKENGSNGCIDTVDVTYPSSPFFLLFNPALLQAQLDPVMRYAALPRWRFPFAPHDLGTYPLANGQVYGGGELNEDNQMPVEESANLILMVAGLEHAEHNWEFARKYMPQLKQWAEYLETKGIDPENQLSTDDFAGHLAHNTNLSIKAIEALGAFVEISRGVGEKDLADRYEHIVRKLPAQWESMALDGDHYKLAFDQPGTWSQKYNLVWDELLGLHLFPPKVMQTEWSYYMKQMKTYGLPLDNRKTITKLDWQIWTASLAADPVQWRDLMGRLVQWIDTSASRVPTTDYYDTETGRQVAFQARSVVGGIFVKALMNPEAAHTWSSKR